MGCKPSRASSVPISDAASKDLCVKVVGDTKVGRSAGWGNPEPLVNYALRFIWATVDTYKTEVGERVFNGCGEIDVN